MADYRKPAVLLPSPPPGYDPRDQAELRRIVMDALVAPSQETINLLCQAKITATAVDTVTIRVGVADPFPQGTGSASIAYAYQVAGGAGTVDKSSPQTCTPETTLTYNAGTYVDFVVTRPDVNTGTGRIVFTVTAANRTQATDAVDVPAKDVVYNECRAAVTASDDLTVTVTVTAVSLAGTPTVGYVGANGATLNSGHAAGTYTYAQNSTDNVWVFNRPVAGAGMGQAQFRAVLSGAQSDDDFVTIIEQVPTVGKVTCQAVITASDADTITVTVYAQSTSGTPRVGYVGLSGAATFNKGHASGTYTYPLSAGTSGTGTVTATAGAATFSVSQAGVVSNGTLLTVSGTVYEVSAFNGTTGCTLSGSPTFGATAFTYSDNVWIFNRADIGAGLGHAQFRATYTGGPETDDDYATINEKGRDSAPLMCRARVVGQTATTVTVRVGVADAYPQGANSATITYQEYHVGATTTPSSGQLVTPSSDLNPFAFLVAEDSTQRLAEDNTVRSNESFTESPPTYVDFTVTRPAFGTGAGRVTFTATAAKRTEDSDAVDIPEVNRDTVYLALRARVTATAVDTVTVRVSVADPICATDPQTATITYQSQGVAAVTPASGQTVTPAATLTEAAGTYCDFVITRPDANTGTGRVTFTATATNRTSDSDAVDVPSQEIAGLTVTLTQTAATGFSDPGAGVLPTVTLTMVVSDPRGLLTGNALVTLATNGISALYNETLAAPAVTFNATIGATYTFTVTLLKALGGGGFVRFTATKTGGYAGQATFWTSSAWADAPADCVITIGSNNGSADTYAKASLTVNTIANADSMKWLASTSSQPTKASTIASGTVVTIGPPFSVADLGVSLAFGDTVYVTVVLYDYAGHLIDNAFYAFSTRSNLSATKTLQWAAAGHFHAVSTDKVGSGFIGLSGILTIDRSVDELFYNAVGPGAGVGAIVPFAGKLSHSFVLADGGTVTAMGAEVWGDSVTSGGGHYTSARITLALYAVAAGTNVADATPIASKNDNATGGWETITQSGLSQSTTGKRFVVTAYISTPQRWETDSVYAKFRTFTVTYLPSTPQATI